MPATESLSYAGFLAREPLFWAALTGLLAGLASGRALSALVRSTGGSRSPRRVRSRRFTSGTLLLSGAVIAAAGGLIIPPGLVILSNAAAIAAGSSFAAGFLSGFFPAAAGVPILVLVGIAALLGASLVSGMLPVRSGTILMDVTVLSIQETGITVEVIEPEREAVLPEVRTLGGREITARVEILDLPAGLFLLGANRFVDYRIGGEGPAFEPAGVLLLTLDYGWWTVDEVEARVSRLNLLERYELRVGPDLPPAFIRAFR